MSQVSGAGRLGRSCFSPRFAVARWTGVSLALQTASLIDRVRLGNRGGGQAFMIATAIRASSLSQAGAQPDEQDRNEAPSEAEAKDARPLPGPLSTSEFSAFLLAWREALGRKASARLRLSESYARGPGRRLPSAARATAHPFSSLPRNGQARPPRREA